MYKYRIVYIYIYIYIYTSYGVSNTTLGPIFYSQNKSETGGRFWTRTYIYRRLPGRTKHFQPFELAFSHPKSILERILGIVAYVHLVRDPNRKWQQMPNLFVFEPNFQKKHEQWIRRWTAPQSGNRFRLRLRLRCVRDCVSAMVPLKLGKQIYQGGPSCPLLPWSSWPS